MPQSRQTWQGTGPRPTFPRGMHRIMRNRKPSRHYLLYSLLIHIALLLGIWRLVPEQEILAPFHAGLDVPWIRHVTPLIVTPPEPPPKVKPPAAEAIKQPPAPPKPQPGLNTEWRGESIATSHRAHEDSIGRDADTASQPALTEGAPRATRVNLPKRVAPPPKRTTAHVEPRDETKPIALGDEAALLNNVSSPTVGAPNVFYAGTRGDVFRTSGMGNSWGGGGGGGGSATNSTNAGGIYSLMKTIARELAAAATAKKVDVVLILDETASMSDNIRGIRGYIQFLFDAMEHDGHDATFILVPFSDEVRTDFLRQPTDDSGTFRNWLFQIGVEGGGDLAEAGLDALMTAVQSPVRRGAQRLFLLASDAAFHDADYDGRSRYSLDEVIETLQHQHIRVDVIGIDYLPIKQLALATGGTWRAIPGKGYLEYVPRMTLTQKMLSKLGTLGVDEGLMGDKITVYVNNPPRPKRLTLTWKVLNPIGERCLGPVVEHRDIPDDGTTVIELNPALDSTAFRTMPGVYTVIYRLENNQGHRSILRRTFTF